MYALCRHCTSRIVTLKGWNNGSITDVDIGMYLYVDLASTIPMLTINPRSLHSKRVNPVVSGLDEPANICEKKLYLSSPSQKALLLIHAKCTVVVLKSRKYSSAPSNVTALDGFLSISYLAGGMT